MSTIVLVALKVTLVLAIANLAGNRLMARAPHLSARVAWLGMMCSSLIVLAVFLNVPGPLPIAWPAPTDPMTPQSLSLVNAAVASENLPTDNGPTGMGHLGWSPNAWMPTAGRTVFAIGAGKDVTDGIARGLIVLVAVVAIMVILRCAAGTWAIIQLRRSMRRLGDDRVQAKVSRIAAHHRWSFQPVVYLSDRIDSPCVTWFRRSEIYVPESFVDWTDCERTAALTHELAHQSRRDAMYRLMADLCLAVIGIHPLAHRLHRHLVLSQELAADRQASTMPTDHSVYQEGLTRLALRIDSQRDRSWGSYGVSVSQNDVIRRIKMLNFIVSPLRKWQEWAVTTSALAIGFLAIAVTAQSDEPVRIARRSVPAPDRVSSTFDRPTSQPWENIGPSDSYVRVLSPAWAAIPELRLNVDAMQSFLADQSDGLDDIQFSQDLQSLETNLIIRTTHQAEPSESGHHWRLETSVGGVHAQFAHPINWALVADRLPWQKLFGVDSDEAQQLGDTMRSQGTARSIRIPVHGPDVPTNHLALTQQVWSLIDGGLIGVVWRVDPSIHSITDEQRQTFEDLGFTDCLQSCQCIGLGMDLEDPTQQWQIKVALVLKPNVDASVAQDKWNAFRDRLVAHQDSDDQLQAIQAYFAAASIQSQTLPDGGPHVLMVTGLVDATSR